MSDNSFGKKNYTRTIFIRIVYAFCSVYFIVVVVCLTYNTTLNICWFLITVVVRTKYFLFDIREDYQEGCLKQTIFNGVVSESYSKIWRPSRIKKKKIITLDYVFYIKCQRPWFFFIDKKIGHVKQCRSLMPPFLKYSNGLCVGGFKRNLCDNRTFFTVKVFNLLYKKSQVNITSLYRITVKYTFKEYSVSARWIYLIFPLFIIEERPTFRNTLSRKSS